MGEEERVLDSRVGSRPINLNYNQHFKHSNDATGVKFLSDLCEVGRREAAVLRRETTTFSLPNSATQGSVWDNLGIWTLL